MTPSRPSSFAKHYGAALAAALALLLAVPAIAAPTKLAETPLQSLNRVKPNVMFTVDDSGSMSFEFLPDFTAEGPPPLNLQASGAGTYYCRDRRNCGGIVDPVNGLPVNPVTGLASWAIEQADPPIRSVDYNKIFYNPAATYDPGKRENGGDLPCEGSNLTCSGPWTAVYRNGFFGYPGANGSSTTNLTNGYPDTVWCNQLASNPPSAADIATALPTGDGSRCRLNGRAYIGASDPGGLWTTPTVAAGYNYPNLVDVATGASTACASANQYCVFSTAVKVFGSPYYYTTSRVQYCQSKDAAGFGTSPCSDRFDEASFRYVRYGTDANQAFDPQAFTRVDITGAGCTVTQGGANSSTTSATCPSGRTAVVEMANFAKWYAFYRTRMLAMKTAAGRAFAALTDQDARVGLHTLWESNTTWNIFLNVQPFDATRKAAWFQKFYEVLPGGGTPLPHAVYRIGEYFANSGNSALPGAVDPLDSVTGRCQANYHLLATDGYWNIPLSGPFNDGNFSGSIGDWDRIVPNSLPGPISGFTPGSTYPRPYYEGAAAAGVGDSLSDLAMYYWIRDLRPSIPDNVKDTIAPWQHVTLYALSIGLQGNVDYPTGVDAITAGTLDWPVPTGAERPDSIDDLWHAAVNSRGKYYNAANPQQLAESIVGSLAEITSQSGTATAVGIAGAQLTATRKYGYRTSYESGWWGDVKKYELDAATGALPAKPDGNPKNEPLWSAAKALDAQALGTGWDLNRRIVTINDESNAAVPFRLASLSPNQRAAVHAGWSVVTPTPPTAQAVLDFLRGDKSNEGTGLTNFRVRAHTLGDIVYSAAVPVGAPSQPYDDTGNPGYPAFALAQKSRTPMVYVGANDGMLHAFIDSTTTDAGNEAWAYVPKALFNGDDPNATVPPPDFRLGALSYRSGGSTPAQFLSKFRVNATPRVWDIDFANTSTKTPPTTGNDWHSILVGGLGAGGRAVYALDVTTPVALTDTEPDIVSSKRVLWEFTDDNLGYVYDAPTLVKTHRYGWVVLVTSGYNNPGGKGYLYVLNPTDGKILKKLSTDVGDDSNPSGLSTIRAYTPSRKDPYVLQAYGGDLRGNVWRFDLSDPDESKWNVELIAKLKDASGKEQPITTGIRIEIDQNNNVDRYLFVGTGKLLSECDLNTVADPINCPGWSPAPTNTLYVIRDGTRTAAEAKPGTPYSRSNLNAVNGSSVAGFTGPATGRGWYQDGTDPQEKITTDVFADVQTVVYSFSKPGVDPCEAVLSSALYARDLITANSVIQSQGGDVVPAITDIGAIAGLALIQGQAGTGSASSGDIRVQVTTMKGQVFSFGVKLAGAASLRHRVSWRLLTRD